ncbi:MAG: SDR family oxidoreductase [Bacteroidia bacterium]
MKVFVTGATGFVGSAVVNELIRVGHTVLGLARNEANAAQLIAAGAQVHKGDLQDAESLSSGAAAADAIIHTGFIHDFTRFAEMCEVDRIAIEALGSAIAGTDKLLLVTSGVGMLQPGKLNDEADRRTPGPNPRQSEEAADALAARGVRAGVVRLPPSVHGVGDHGFVPILISLAREKGLAVYTGAGQNKWPAVHRFDAAVLYRLAIEKGFEPGARFHGVAEQGIAFKDIAEVIGRRLNVPVASKTPEEAAAYYTWFTHFAAMDCPSSSQYTRDYLGWQPTCTGLIEDIDEEAYFKV